MLYPGHLIQARACPLKAQVTPPGQQCLPRSMRAALWWLLPSDGEFQRAPSGNQYYLAHQGWRVVLRGGDVTQAGFGSHINWIYDPAPPPPRRATLHSRNSNVSIPVIDVKMRYPPLLRAAHYQLLSPQFLQKKK